MHPWFLKVRWFLPFLPCKSSTINGLLYALEALIVARRYDVPRDWLWDACHMAGVRWGSRYKGFCSKEGLHYCITQSARNITINLIHELEIPWGFHTRAVLRSSAGLMSREKVSVQQFLWVKKVWFAFAQRTFAQAIFVASSKKKDVGANTGFRRVLEERITREPRKILVLEGAWWCHLLL